MDPDRQKKLKPVKREELGASGLGPDRAFRGSAIAPAPALRAVAASHPSNPLRGFLVHVWADYRKNRLYFTGRLEDGRSFGAMDDSWVPAFHIYENDLERSTVLLSRVKHRVLPPEFEAFSGKERLVRLSFERYSARTSALDLLEAGGIASPDGGLKPADDFLIRRFIRGPVEIRGESRRGRHLDLVFTRPELKAAEGPVKAALKIASIDIETDTRKGSVRAVGISLSGADFARMTGQVRVLLPAGFEPPEAPAPEAGAAAETPPEDGGSPQIYYHNSERTLLEAFVNDIREMDPDVLTGWNFLDFDYPHLAKRCGTLGSPFALGRAGEEAKYFPGEAGGGWRKRSAAALVPGRQVIDALRVVRSGPRGWGYGSYADFTLETVAQTILGEGKIVSSKGEDKIAELDALYDGDPVLFGQYCYRDAELALRILNKTGLFSLTVERAALTGVSLDKAWTSVVSFERIYGLELRRRGIAPPPPPPADFQVSGAAGGAVLEPLPGFFPNVAVFDFRSLYPTIMRTFNIDPWTHARAKDGEGVDAAPAPAAVIHAPNGAEFSRETGVLPRLIAGYFESRRAALLAGDETAAFVYKILMNSFYGVLGTASCCYARTELAGAITSFARKWLHFSRDWFAAQGYRVLYGDTDSLFVASGLGDDASYQEFQQCCGNLAEELNARLSEQVRDEYQRESFMELRFEKVYRRLIIPHLRNFHGGGEQRGRAKGYGGYLLGEDGTTEVEVKGMEAVRSDATPLARRLQLDLLELVFQGGGEGEFKEKVRGVLRELRSGKLDAEIVYRKRLSRPPETYTAATPPQVKAARALGWKGRRGTVEFLWTVNGPEPLSLSRSALDYDHYTDSQVLPVAQSIAAAMGWHGELFPQKGRNREAMESGQLELEL
ncbi:MAG: DNA polymerase II [Treponema sp.]|jgi:DNA polymerase-2|nr:DNA polymerase II [Treponema sp.]